MPSTRLASVQPLTRANLMRRADACARRAAAGSPCRRWAPASPGATAGLTGAIAWISARRPAGRRRGRRGMHQSVDPRRRPTRTPQRPAGRACRCRAQAAATRRRRPIGARGRGLSVVRRRRQGALGTCPSMRESGLAAACRRDRPILRPTPSHSWTVLAIARARLFRVKPREPRQLIATVRRILPQTVASVATIRLYRVPVKTTSCRQQQREPRATSVSGSRRDLRAGEPGGLARSTRRPPRSPAARSARRPRPGTRPGRRASPSDTPPGPSAPGCAGATRSAARPTRAALPGLLGQLPQQRLGRLLAEVGAAAGQVPAPGARDSPARSGSAAPGRPGR